MSSYKPCPPNYLTGPSGGTYYLTAEGKKVYCKPSKSISKASPKPISKISSKAAPEKSLKSKILPKEKKIYHDVLGAIKNKNITELKTLVKNPPFRPFYR